jgi:hypothetical protein
VRFLGPSVTKTIPLHRGGIYAVIKSLVARLEPAFTQVGEIEAKIADLENSADRFESRQACEHSSYQGTLGKVRGLIRDPGVPATLQGDLRRLASILESNPNDSDRIVYLNVARTIRTTDEAFWRAQRGLINRALDLWMNAGTRTSVREGKWDQQSVFARRAAAEQRKSLDPLWSSIFSVPDEVAREHQEDTAINRKELHVHIKEMNLMEAKYKITGGHQVAVGDGANASYFNQAWTTNAEQINLPQLATELAVLRGALGVHVRDDVHRTAANEVALAEESARSGDGPQVLEHLKKAGAWFWDVATKIGIGIATAAAKRALGL